MHLLDGVHHKWDFERKRPKRRLDEMPGIIYFEAQSLAEGQVRIGSGRALDALIADKSTSNYARQFVLLRRGVGHEGNNCHQDSDGEVFQRHFSSRSQLRLTRKVVMQVAARLARTCVLRRAFFHDNFLSYTLAPNCRSLKYSGKSFKIRGREIRSRVHIDCSNKSPFPERERWADPVTTRERRRDELSNGLAAPKPHSA